MAKQSTREYRRKWTADIILHRFLGWQSPSRQFPTKTKDSQRISHLRTFWVNQEHLHPKLVEDTTSGIYLSQVKRTVTSLWLRKVYGRVKSLQLSHWYQGQDSGYHKRKREWRAPDRHSLLFEMCVVDAWDQHLHKTLGSIHAWCCVEMQHICIPSFHHLIHSWCCIRKYNKHLPNDTVVSRRYNRGSAEWVSLAT